MTATPLVSNTFFGLDISRLASQLMSLRRRLSKRLLLLEFSASGLLYAEAAPRWMGFDLATSAGSFCRKKLSNVGSPATPL